MVEPAAFPHAAALASAGLQIEADPEAESGSACIISGNTFPHKDILKAHGGRWSKRRSAWVFDDPAMVDQLGQSLSGGVREGTKPGFAEAPMHFQPLATPRWSKGDEPGGKKRERPHFHGHRERLRARFMSNKDDMLPDYELLELLLFFSIRYVDVKPLAKLLLNEFGSLGGVLAADQKRIEGLMCSLTAAEGGQIEKDSYFTIVQLKAMRRLLERVLVEEVEDRPVISSWQALLDYLKVALGHDPIEQFRLLFLDKKNILIKDSSAWGPERARHEDSKYNDPHTKYDDIQQRGTVDNTPLYPREIAKRALELGASALIMVHNHPSGDPTPSRADIEMTKQVEAALAPIRVALHDHLIIGKDRHLSFKSEGLL